MIEIKGKISKEPTAGNFCVLRIEVAKEDEDRILMYLEHERQDIDMSVSIKRWHKRRTLTQNKLFHAIIAEIAIATGMDSEIIKAGIKEQFGVRVDGGLNGEHMMVPKPSRLCDTKEISQLINGAILEASTLGVDLSKYIKDIQEWRKNDDV